MQRYGDPDIGRATCRDSVSTSDEVNGFYSRWIIANHPFCFVSLCVAPFRRNALFGDFVSFLCFFLFFIFLLAFLMRMNGGCGVSDERVFDSPKTRRFGSNLVEMTEKRRQNLFRTIPNV